jgi:hypothetical protein
VTTLCGHEGRSRWLITISLEGLLPGRRAVEEGIPSAGQ